MAVASVADILGSLGASAVRSAGDSSAVNDIADNLKRVKEDEATQMQRASKDAELVRMTEQQGQLNRQAANARAKQQLNVDEVMATVATQLHSEFLKAEQLDATIQKKESVGFFDNPFEYIVNQTTINDDIDAYNATADSINRKTGYIKEVQNLTQEAAQTNLATMETVSEASAAASARVAGMEFLTRANDAKIAAGTIDLNRINQLSQIDNNRLDLLLKQRQQVNSEEDQAMQRANFAAEQKERAIRLAQFQEDAKDKNKKREVEAKYLAIANAGAKVLGIRQFSSTEDFEIFRRANKDGKEKADRLLDVGYQVLDRETTGKQIKLGDSPADIGKFLVNTRGTLAPTQRKIQELITSTHQGVASGTLSGVDKGASIDLKNPAAVTAQANKLIGITIETMQKDSTADREKNIYATPTLSSVAATVPAIKNNNLYIKLIEPQLKVLGDKPINPQELINQTAVAMKNKSITFAEGVQGLERLFGAAVVTNNVLNSYESVGLPAQKKLNAPYKASDAIPFYSTKTRDFASPTDVKAALVARLTAMETERGADPASALNTFETLISSPQVRN